jgi:hypothetical protein
MALASVTLPAPPSARHIRGSRLHREGGAEIYTAGESPGIVVANQGGGRVSLSTESPTNSVPGRSQPKMISPRGVFSFHNRTPDERV